MDFVEVKFMDFVEVSFVLPIVCLKYVACNPYSLTITALFNTDWYFIASTLKRGCECHS